MNLLEELEERVVCGDGAMGTMLLDRRAAIDCCLEEISISNPDYVRAIHNEYIAAGARVIETNTFGANTVRLQRFGFGARVREINFSAAQLAIKAAKGKNVYVAGSVGPLGITRDDAAALGIDRAGCFRDQVTALVEAGVDAIFFETFLDFDEMEIALCTIDATNCPMVALFSCGRDGRLRCGMPLSTAFERARALGATIVGANCVNGPDAMLQLFETIGPDHLLAAYPNAGYPAAIDGQCVYPTGPNKFALAARDLALRGARLVGGCCGTTPAHIAAMARALAAIERAASSSNKQLGSVTG